MVAQASAPQGNGTQSCVVCGIAFAFFLLSSTVVAAQLTVLPNKLELTGQDPSHGVVVSFADDNGEVTDVTRRVTLEIDKPELASVDHRGMVTGRSDGDAVLRVKLDAWSVAVPIVVTASGERRLRRSSKMCCRS